MTAITITTTTTTTTTLSATSLAVTVAHTVTFLTRPLATSLSHSSFSALQTALEANLAPAFASTWAPHDPSRGSGRRVLTFSPGAAPPRPIYKASVAVGVDWAIWTALLTDREFDLVVDPGLVYLRVPRQWSQPSSILVWSANGQHLQYQQQLRDFLKGPIQAQQQQQQPVRISAVHTPQPIPAASSPLSVQHHQPSKKKKTLAQCLAEDDAEDEEALFSLIAAEMREPAWKSPIAESFPAAAAAPCTFTLTGPAVSAATATSLTNAAAASFLLGHSRSSSRSSVTSASTSSSFISDDALSSCSSLSSVSTSSTAFSDAGSTTTSTSLSVPSTRKGHGNGNGHGRARSSRVFIDTSRTEVTPYDGGKTTVLTGGVMLGAPPSRNSHAASRNKVPRF